jgi:hypothetical protein
MSAWAFGLSLKEQSAQVLTVLENNSSTSIVTSLKITEKQTNSDHQIQQPPIVLKKYLQAYKQPFSAQN